MGITLIQISTVFKPSSASRQEYDELLRLSGKGQEVTSYTSKQKRDDVQKDMWTHMEEGRLHTRLNCESSEISYIQHGAEGEIIESMQGITCFMQEKIYSALPDGREAYLQPNGKWLIKNADPHLDSSWVSENQQLKPMQVIRFFQADKGTYYYHRNFLEAEKVNISRYAIPGNELPASLKGFKPVLTGTAKGAQLSFGKEIQFTAQQFKATLFQTKDHEK